jgi:Na+/H+ antiporter NhaD/arsenite permease-like protein
MPVSLFAAAVIEPNPLMIAPFVVMLLSIALMPFLNKEWWEAHFPKVAIVLGAITTAYYVFGLNNPTRMLHLAKEYISFISLIGSLFVVSGGIHIRVKGESTPAINCLFLFIGAILANLVGTTGASMLLLRPWIRMNKYRITTFHIVFFIFIVSNVGGCLTPIGDPPLFLGYLRGVPFWWVMQACWKAWIVAVFALIAVFYVIDRANFLRAPAEIRQMETAREEWKFEGLLNLSLLGVILGAIFLQDPPFVREALMIGAAVASYRLTPKPIHEANDFTFHPIREVAWLFVGIFATMVPALDYLELHAKGMGLSSPMAFYWLAGSLSAVLDNAPTYLTFLAAAMGLHDLSLNSPQQVGLFASEHGRELVAVSLGAVFFGAVTYIGNGPNFMVKAIAEHAKVKTPDFFAYIFKYSLPILLPIFAIIAFFFFSK